MPSNSKGTAKSKRKSRVNKAVDKEKKTKKRRKKTKAQIRAEAKAAFGQIEENKTKAKEESIDNTVTTAVVPVSLVSRAELEQLTRDNSFLLNPLLANASIQHDLIAASNRAKDLVALHEYLFDPANQSTFEEKTLVSLYSAAIQDHHKTIQEKIKLAEMSDKARILREATKYYAEQEKQKEMEAVDNSHTSEIIRALLSESMRKAMDDELQKKWGGSNSYRPPENTNYEILAVDPDAEE